MPYRTPASTDTPGLIIYLVDLSLSMNAACGARSRVAVVAHALERTRRTLVARSLRGDQVRPRYAVAMLGYSSTVVDLLGGVRTVDQLEMMQLPALTADGGTNTGAAFREAERLLHDYLPRLKSSPAPLICHLSDGAANMGEPAEPIVERIKNLGTDDGAVLVENIYIGTDLLRQPIGEPHDWRGVRDPALIRHQHVRELWQMASPLPVSYAEILHMAAGYSLEPDTRMLFPAETPSMVELAFAVSSSTPVQTWR